MILPPEIEKIKQDYDRNPPLPGFDHRNWPYHSSMGNICFWEGVEWVFARLFNHPPTAGTPAISKEPSP